jgi:hypothetical protein
VVEQQTARDLHEHGDLWLEILIESFRSGDPGPSLDVAFCSGAERVRLRYAQGRLQLAADTERDPELVLWLGAISVRDVLLGKAPARELIGQARIESAGQLRRVAPATEEQLPSQGRFQPIPGATLSVGIHVTSTAVGEVGICERWQDGVLISSEVIPIGQLLETPTEIRMSCSLGRLATLRRSELTPLDALAEGMGLFGEWPQLMCFAELMQHPAYRMVWEADPTLEAEAAWGTVFCSSEYGDSALRAQLDPVGVA